MKHPADDRTDPQGFGILLARYFEAAAPKYSATTLHNRIQELRGFVAWCAERDLTRPADVTRTHLEHYQRMLHHAQKANGAPLAVRTQHTRLSAVMVFFRWLARRHLILFNPASEIELPKTPRHSLRNVLTAAQVERVLNLVNLGLRMGLRDRAMLETLYSTGIRRGEICGVRVDDLDRERGTLRIRYGKGGDERVVPIGTRAVRWIDRYVTELRPELLAGAEEPTLFLMGDGKPITRDAISNCARDSLERAGIRGVGACHLFRHTMATLMLEGGADVRYIQAILGHRKLESTEIYTHVSIQKLKAVHTATHPGANLRRKKVDETTDDNNEQQQESPLLAADLQDDDGDDET